MEQGVPRQRVTSQIVCIDAAATARPEIRFGGGVGGDGAVGDGGGRLLVSSLRGGCPSVQARFPQRF